MSRVGSCTTISSADAGIFDRLEEAVRGQSRTWTCWPWPLHLAARPPPYQSSSTPDHANSTGIPLRSVLTLFGTLKHVASRSVALEDGSGLVGSNVGRRRAHRHIFDIWMTLSSAMRIMLECAPLLDRYSKTYNHDSNLLWESGVVNKTRIRKGPRLEDNRHGTARLELAWRSAKEVC